MPAFLTVRSADLIVGGTIDGTIISDVLPTTVSAPNSTEVSVAAISAFQAVTPTAAASSNVRLMSSNLDAISNGGPNVPFLNRAKTGFLSLPGDPKLVSDGSPAMDAYTDADGWLHSLPSGYTYARMLFDWRTFEPSYHEVPHDIKWTGPDSAVTLNNMSNVTKIADSHYRATPQLDGNWWLDVVSFPGASGNYVKDIEIYRTQDQALIAAGEIFTPQWVSACTGLKELRFMDWQRTNDANTVMFSGVPKDNFYGYGQYPVSPEIIAAMANKVGADPWVCMPHNSGPAYWDDFAGRLFATLNSNLKVKVTYTNESWNFNMPQFGDTVTAANALWSGTEDVDYWHNDYYGYQLTRILPEFEKHFPRNRIKLVLETHANNINTTTARLNATAWLNSGDPSYLAPSSIIDEIAVTTYLGASLAKDAETRALLLEAIANRTEAEVFNWLTSFILGDGVWGSGAFDRMEDAITTHKTLADTLSVPLTLYEGGQHLLLDWAQELMPQADRDAIIAVLIPYINSDHMAALYQMTSDFWLTISPNEPLMQFGLVGPDSNFGAWALVKNYGQPYPPRAQLMLTGYAQGGAVVDYTAFLIPLTPRYLSADVRGVSATTEGVAINYNGSPLTNASIDGGSATGAVLAGSELRNSAPDGFKGQSGNVVLIAADEGYFIVSLIAAPAGDYVQTWLATDGSAQASTFQGGFVSNKVDAPQVSLSLWAKFANTQNFSRWIEVGDGLALRWDGVRHALRVKDTTGTIVGDVTSTVDEPLDVAAHHYIAVDLSVPSLVWKRNGVDVTYTATTPLSSGTGLVSRDGALYLAGQTGTAMEYADVSIYYGSIASAAELYNAGTPPDPRTIGLPDYLVSYPMQADQDAFGGTEAGLNDGYHLGSANPFDTASGWTNSN